LHGFNGYKPGTLPLAPGSHAIEIDYMQVHTPQQDSCPRRQTICMFQIVFVTT